MSQTPTQPQISGTMFLFQRPELLNKEQHGAFGINRSEKPFGFCAKIRAVPLTVSEVAAAMKYYPIVFTTEKNIIPVAVVGVIDDVNLFVDEEGKWEEDAYVPGYIRRYPFALANESGGDRLALVVDAGHEHVKAGADMPFFQDGQPTEATQSVLEFCKQYEKDKVLTDRLFSALEPYNLVAAQTAQYTTGGQQQSFAQYFGFDEKRLNELSDAQFLELRKSGALPVIYSQLISMTNWRMLIQRRARRFQLNDETILKPVQLS